MRLKVVFILLLIPGISWAQTREDLEKQRSELNSKIAYTNKLIAASKKDQTDASKELQALNRQITLRNRLISNLSAEMRELDAAQSAKYQEMQDLELAIDKLKEEYAQMIYNAYKNSNSYDQLMYIFAAEDFNQAFMRLKLMQRYGEVRTQHKAEIEAKRARLEAGLLEIETLKQDQHALLEAKSAEKEKLASDKSVHENTLGDLKTQESKLRKTQQQQESERKRINRAIQLKLEEEINADRNRDGGAFGLTPEGLIISENFEKNKGKLPWPVTRGVIIQHFGEQPHAYVRELTVVNNGVDIATDAGMKVRAIFDGEVTSVFSIPGAGQNIIVTHGQYKTVYTNLSNVSVRKGDSVTAYQELGQLVEQDGSSTAHLEIWKISSSGGKAQNPEYWISK